MIEKREYRETSETEDLADIKKQVVDTKLAALEAAPPSVEIENINPDVKEYILSDDTGREDFLNLIQTMLQKNVSGYDWAEEYDKIMDKLCKDMRENASIDTEKFPDNAKGDALLRREVFKIKTYIPTDLLIGLDSDGDGIDDGVDVDQTRGVDANRDGIDDGMIDLNFTNLEGMTPAKALTRYVLTPVIEEVRNYATLRKVLFDIRKERDDVLYDSSTTAAEKKQAENTYKTKSKGLIRSEYRRFRNSNPMTNNTIETWIKAKVKYGLKTMGKVEHTSAERIDKFLAKERLLLKGAKLYEFIPDKDLQQVIQKVFSLWVKGADLFENQSDVQDVYAFREKQAKSTRRKTGIVWFDLQPTPNGNITDPVMEVEDILNILDLYVP